MCRGISQGTLTAITNSFQNVRGLNKEGWFLTHAMSIVHVPGHPFSCSGHPHAVTSGLGFCSPVIPHPLKPWGPALPSARMVDIQSVDRGTRIRSRAWEWCARLSANHVVPHNCQGGWMCYPAVSRRKRKSGLIGIKQSLPHRVLHHRTRCPHISQAWNSARVAPAGYPASSFGVTWFSSLHDGPMSKLEFSRGNRACWGSFEKTIWT